MNDEFVIEDNYIRFAEVVRVVDGDTVDAIVDLGYTVRVHQRFRLEGIDAPETRGEERDHGLATKEFVANLLTPGTKVLVRSRKAGKFGRYLGVIYYKEGSRWINLNTHLLDLGLAEEYKR